MKLNLDIVKSILRNILTSIQYQLVKTYRYNPALSAVENVSGGSRTSAFNRMSMHMHKMFPQ